MILVASSIIASTTALITTTTNAHALLTANIIRSKSPLLLSQQQQQQPKHVTTSLFSSTNNEVEALLAAAKKAREEAIRLSEELGKPITTTSSSTSTSTTTITKPSQPAAEVNVQEMIQTILPSILSETMDLQIQKQQWEELKNEKRMIQQFASANLRTYPVSLSMLEQRTGFTAKSLGITDENLNGNVSLDDFKYATLWVTGGSTILAIASLAVLPPNIGATFCYAFALIPVLFLGIGSTAPGIIADGIAMLRGDNNNNESSSGTDGTTISTKQDRICRHEAAHFCCGYWCGLPISSYNTAMNNNTGNNNANVPRVEFDVSTPPGKGYTTTEIAALTITAMSGIVGEAMKYGTVVDGSATQDLITLENSIFRKSQDFIGAASSQDLTRWGVLASYLLLQQNKDTYEKVVQAFQRQASIEECITILEKF